MGYPEKPKVLYTFHGKEDAMLKFWPFGRPKTTASAPQEETAGPHPDTTCMEEDDFEAIDPGDFQERPANIPPGFNPYGVWDKEAYHRARRTRNNKT